MGVPSRRHHRSTCCCHPLLKPFVCRRYDVLLMHSHTSNDVWIGRRTRRTVRNAIQWGIFTFVVLVLVLWLGAEYEGYHVRRSPETLHYYQQPQVCGIIISNSSMALTNDTHHHHDETMMIEEAASNSTTNATPPSLSPLITITTFPSERDVLDTGGFVAHCGSCGHCSNPHDIRIYDQTQKSLFESSTTCAKRALIWGRVTAGHCLQTHVGFTNNCNECWVENILCDLRKCIFTCLFYGLFGDVDGGAGQSTNLNPCTQCDERRCGPDFIQCAGANRRRSGIVSDISRDEINEVCQTVRHDWWWDQDLHDHWERSNQYDDHDGGF